MHQRRRDGGKLPSMRMRVFSGRKGCRGCCSTSFISVPYKVNDYGKVVAVSVEPGSARVGTLRRALVTALVVHEIVAAEYLVAPEL